MEIILINTSSRILSSSSTESPPPSTTPSSARGGWGTSTATSRGSTSCLCLTGEPRGSSTELMPTTGVQWSRWSTRERQDIRLSEAQRVRCIVHIIYFQTYSSDCTTNIYNLDRKFRQKFLNNRLLNFMENISQSNTL